MTILCTYHISFPPPGEEGAEWSRECAYWCFCWYNESLSLIFCSPRLNSSVSDCPLLGSFISWFWTNRLYFVPSCFARCHYWSYYNAPWCHEDKTDGSGEYFFKLIFRVGIAHLHDWPISCWLHLQGQGTQYAGIVNCAQTILREEGPRAFLKVKRQWILLNSFNTFRQCILLHWRSLALLACPHDWSWAGQLLTVASHV